MKEALLAYVHARINWHKLEQERLRREDRRDEAAHLQIAINVYSIFLSTYQAMKYDHSATLERFSAIAEVWKENHRKAHEHDDLDKKLIEEIKISRAMEIIRQAKELEMTQHD